MAARFFTDAQGQTVRSGGYPSKAAQFDLKKLEHLWSLFSGG